MVNPSKDYYFMQRNTSPLESITVEYGFLDSKNDDVNQLKNNWKKYAEATIQGILNYIGYMDVINDNIYIVKKGDSLYSIAQKYNTTVEELKRINNLDSNQLVIGQQLIIPTLEDIEENYYIVKAGDNLYSIANKYNISVNELKSINNLVSDNLYIGQKILLVSNESKNDNVYVVKVGDTLYSIAKRYNIPVIDLINANNINDNIIVVGQELIIPNNIDNNEIYIVEAGDTLYSIARRYNTTIKDIMDKNNLTSNILSIGQELKI